jgi:hypothetical protein
MDVEVRRKKEFMQLVRDFNLPPIIVGDTEPVWLQVKRLLPSSFFLLPSSFFLR